MWPLPVLFLLIIQGHFSKCQDGVVRGTAKGTLTTYCMYGQGWESYNKWWCRGENWMSCKILVKTTGSEQLVKKGRASIQDNASQRKFTMTLEDLRYDDAGTYWCGIERIGSDLGSKFSVIIDPEPDPTDSPQPVSSTTPASWDSSPPSTQVTNSSPPVTPTNPISRSGKMASSVAAKKPPVWTLLLPLFLVTLEGLCQT
ncbi:CMRF35-like molecule 7 isoform X1 [Mustela nigripes]|uniref:CMRF35-like molecule 7 isoform X1 n=1 Tax=Mustela nigripes TaxID=77151 RepID=UPI002815E569|nr:CMRF35-like molecule 7 isoform X1 [Mustela nigripes]